jgi:hypothetical protein
MTGEEIESEHYVVCGVYAENLGAHKPYFAQEHLTDNQIISSTGIVLRRKRGFYCLIFTGLPQ